MELKTKKNQENIWNRFVNKFFDSHNYSSRRKFYNSLWSILLGVLVTMIIISFFGYNPISVFLSFFQDSNNSNIFVPTIVTFIFSSLAIAICFKAGIFNIGVPGQMMISGFITLVLIRSAVEKNGFASHGTIFLSIFVSMLLCVLCSLLIGVMKVYLNINEVVTSIMLNWVIFFLIRYFVSLHADGFLSTPTDWGQGVTTGYTSDQLPGFYYIDYGSWYSSAWSWVLIITSIIVSLIIWIVIKYTKFGYKIKMVGLSVTASDYSGTNRKNLTLIALSISGLLSSLAGFVWYFSTQQGQLNINITSGPLYVGFNAIAVSLIVFDNPIAIIFSSILFSIISVGSQNTAAFPGLPNEMTDVISGIFIYSAALAFVFSKFLPYQWTRNFFVLVRYKKYREKYWKNWKEFFVYIGSWFTEKKELFLLWKNNHKKWSEIKNEIKKKTNQEQDKLKQSNSKFIFEKLSNEQQIEYLNYLSMLKKEKDFKLSEANYFDRNTIKSKRKDRYFSWSQQYLEMKQEIINYHFKVVEEKIQDSTSEIAAKELDRINKKGDQDK